MTDRVMLRREMLLPVPMPLSYPGLFRRHRPGSRKPAGMYLLGG